MNKQQKLFNQMDTDKLIATALQCLENRMTYTSGETLNGLLISTPIRPHQPHLN
jgi:hypothetical protein